MSEELCPGHEKKTMFKNDRQVEMFKLIRHDTSNIDLGNSFITILNWPSAPKIEN